MSSLMRSLGIGLTTLVALTLTACRLPTSLAPHPSSAGNPATVTLRLSGWQSNPTEQRLLQQVLRQFEAQHPHIRVKYEVINSEYMDVIKTRLIGEVAPDVFYLDAFEAPLLMQHNVLEPLDAYITPDFERSDFEPRLLQAFQHNGKLYGLPKDFSTLALIYNKAAFTAEGMQRPPKTWNELLSFSKMLTQDRNQDGKPDRYGFGLAPELARQAFMIQAYGGQLVNQYGYASFATPDALKGLRLVIDQYRHRTAAQPTDVGASGGSDMLGQGKAAMVIEGPWALPYLQETFPELSFGVAEVPSVNGKPGTMAFTVAYVMNRQSKHKAAAWQLIAYLTSKEGMKAWATQGLALPARRSVLTALGYDRNPLYAPFVAGASYATIWQAGETLPILRTNFNNQFISALLGEQSLTDAMKKAQETANREIYLSN